MERKVKYTVALAIAIIALGVFIALPATLAEEAPPEDNAIRTHRPHRYLPPKLRLMLHVLRRGEPAELEAITVVLEGHILVVEVEGDLVNIIMPGRWIYEGESLTLQDLFDGEPLGMGEAMTIYTLKLEMTRETHIVTAYFAYEIEVETGTASAILPFNIEA